ncbi:hypothetical protein [Microbacterium sp. 3J1]|uniref:hypothetical protein n=1 Tax=Microbacterium sp. 3J1 TaxID=861269 RepID=UPI000AB5BD84|nr:hypothetical protein [Microbacterium sp. 3J1]
MSRRLENALVLTGGDALLLYQAAHLRELRVKARGRSERLYELLTDITKTALSHSDSVDGKVPRETTERDESQDMEIVNVGQLARRAGVTPRTIRNHILLGLIKAEKANRTWLISAQDADQYISGRQAA